MKSVVRDLLALVLVALFAFACFHVSAVVVGSYGRVLHELHSALRG